MDITDQNDRPLSDQNIKPQTVELPDIDQLTMSQPESGSLEEFKERPEPLDTTNFSDLKLEDEK